MGFFLLSIITSMQLTWLYRLLYTAHRRNSERITIRRLPLDAHRLPQIAWYQREPRCIRFLALHHRVSSLDIVYRITEDFARTLSARPMSVFMAAGILLGYLLLFIIFNTARQNYFSCFISGKYYNIFFYFPMTIIVLHL